MFAIVTFFEWEILLGLGCCYSMTVYSRGRGDKLSFMSQQGIFLDLMKRTVPIDPRIGDKITGISGEDLVLSPLGQKVYVCGQEHRLLVYGKPE